MLILEIEANELKSQSFNIWQDARYKVLSIDKKSQFILLKHLAEFLINIHKEVAGEIVNEEIIMNIRNRAEEMESNLFGELIEEKDSLPIFDV